MAIAVFFRLAQVMRDDTVECKLLSQWLCMQWPCLVLMLGI